MTTTPKYVRTMATYRAHMDRGRALKSKLVAELRAAHAAGATHETLAAELGLTRQRVSALIASEPLGPTRKEEK